MSSRILAITLILLAMAGVASAGPSTADELWYTQVEPLLDRSCFKCHGGVRQKSGLDLRSLEKILEGGDRGPAINPGEPEESHLYQFVLKSGDPHMPQDERKQLGDREIAAIRDWIKALPKTSSLQNGASNSLTFAEMYVSALRASQKPTWIPPDALAPHEVIDRFIQLAWKERNIQGNSICDDRAFARRVYLDLAGRIPSQVELVSFLEDRAAEKRARLVDSLLDGDEYPRRLREVFDVILMERRDANIENERREHGWFAFLEHAFRENYGWDRILREIILARPVNAKDQGAIWYVYERKNNYQAISEALAPIAFGFQIGCAQCHNHPLAAEVEQRHYWGLVAAFNRSKNVECTSGSGVAESAIGGFINFTNLKKESQPVQLAFLNGSVIPEARPAEGEKETDSSERYLIPPPKEKEKPEQPSVPKFSRRQKLADAITQNNPQLARAFVNRIWALLLGRGLVQPVDQIDARHRPSHPELFDWLAKDFERSGYDIKHLVREIVLSQTYQLKSRPTQRTAAPPETFARALEKPLSGEQLSSSWIVATGNPISNDGKVAGHDEREVRQAFVRQFGEVLSPEYNASLQQATFLSNSPILEDLLQPRDGNTMARLIDMESNTDRVQFAFEAVLGRNPDSEESKECTSFLDEKSTEKGTRDLLWALLADPEFQMNH